MSRWKIIFITIVVRLSLVALYIMGINSLEPVEPFMWWNWVGVLMLILLMIVGITVVGNHVEDWVLHKVKLWALIIAFRNNTKEQRKAERREIRAKRKAAKA